MRFYALALIVGSTAPGSALPDALRPFTVTDSIEMTRLIDPDIAFEQFQRINFKFSPDGERFVIVLRKGNMQSGMNEYSLILFDTAQVVKFLNAPAGSPRPPAIELARFETATRKHGIDDLRWLPKSRVLAFIGRGVDAVGQVYAVDADTRTLTQLTRHPTDIARFDLSWAHQMMVYSAYEAPDWEDRNKHGYAVGAELAVNVFMRNVADAGQSLSYFVANLHEKIVSRVKLDVGMIPRALSISPDARSAIVLVQAPKLPRRWAEYEFVAAYLKQAESVQENADSGGTGANDSGEFIEDDAFGLPSHWMNQAYIVNLQSQSAKLLHDAPVVGVTFGATTAWSPDGSRVLVAGTYLPLDVADPAERMRRRRSKAIAEIDVRTGAITRIADLIDRMPTTGKPILVTDWRMPEDGEIVLTQREYGGQELPPQRFVKRRAAWIEHEARLPAANGVRSADRRRIGLRVAQDMNTPPDVAAIDLTSGRERLITDLNPQLRKLSLGRVETFTWTDRLGRQLAGGLVLPSDFASGKRYPLVIQTYGFRAEEFLIDGAGGMMTAYAARALVNRGMLVLQMPEADGDRRGDERTYEDLGENPRFTAGLEGAIDALDAKGLIDRTRVGLVGFSREGMHVHHAVTFSRYPIAAATIADSIAATPLCYTLVYGIPYPGMLEWEDERFIGAPLWGSGVNSWIERSPVFHLDKIRTPLRIESHGAGMDCYWDTFAILKRHRRAVELIRLPTGSHRLETPFARYTSQQGNVDWLAFWLKGEEDADPRKAEQYRRWRKLRAQHETTFGLPATGVQ